MEFTMASEKKYDLKRLRKTYHDIRFREKILSSGTQVEGGTLTWTEELDAKTYTFTSSYSSAPNVVITPSSTENGNVNVYIKSITTTNVVIEPSASWTGTVYIQIVKSET